MRSGYKILLVSSVGERDGVSVELALEDGTLIAEVFENEDGGARTVTLFRGEIPLDVLEWFFKGPRKACSA